MPATILDITGKLEHNMWNYGAAIPNIVIERIATCKTDGYDLHAIRLHGLAGTYLETARHLFDGREHLDEIDPARFIVKAWVAQLKDKGPLQQITAEELIQAVGGKLQAGEALLISTGWDQHWNTAEFTAQSPYLSDDAMDWIIEQDVSLLGLDITSIEDPRKPDTEMDLLARYYAKDRLMMAPVVRLREAGEGPWELSTLPLHAVGVCAAPCRAILRKITSI